MRIYKGSESIEIHPIDYPGWAAERWVSEVPTTDGVSDPQTQEVQEDRLSQIQAMAWQEIQSLATQYGLEKPEGTPWKAFAEEIVKHERS
jgi:hypothetical protein